VVETRHQGYAVVSLAVQLFSQLGFAHDFRGAEEAMAF
jgi:hypothetical protein